MSHVPELLASVLQIIWINVLLSGDNAVVIALACRDLDARHLRLAVTMGCVAAIVLRLICSFFIVTVLHLPLVRLFGGALLLWIAVQLLLGDDDPEVGAAPSLWAAVRTIAFADAIMSLDNVFAVTAAARGSMPLVFFGIVLSLPLIVVGATMILYILRRFPFLIAAGATLLGWVAGEMIASEPRLAAFLAQLSGWNETWASLAGAAFIAFVAFIRSLALARQRKSTVQAIEPRVSV